MGREARAAAAVTPAALLSAALSVAAAAPADPPSSASAGTPDRQHGKVLYVQHCAACHGGRGFGDGPREIPALAGQHEAYLIEQLTRFADGERAGSPMHGPAMRDTLKATDVNRPPAIRDLAAYLAHTPAAAEVELGEGRALAEARSAYRRSCAGCHGEDGIGPDGGTAPRIAGQHFRYLLSRLRDFAAVHGGRVAPPALSADEQQALADFIARLPGGSAP